MAAPRDGRGGGTLTCHMTTRRGKGQEVKSLARQARVLGNTPCLDGKGSRRDAGGSVTCAGPTMLAGQLSRFQRART